MDTTYCPDCGALAEVEWRTVLESTDGPVEHARTRCLEGHWFLLPLASLRPTWSEGTGAVRPARPRASSREADDTRRPMDSGLGR